MHPSWHRLRILLIPALLILSLSLVACGGGEQPPAAGTALVPTSPPEPGPVAAANGSIEPVIVSSDLAVGPNRFVVGLVDREKGSLVVDAQLHFRLFTLSSEGRSLTLKMEMDARPLTLEENYTHVHPDGTNETHGAGIFGVYVANVEFDQPGEWGLEITGTLDGQPLPTLTPGFTVQEQSSSITVGEPAPRTVQTILSDVEDVFAIDTSNPPDPHMHDMTIADAVTSGRPTVIVFATPGFCHTQTCGPTKDVVDEAYQKYQGQVNFIHVEPYDLAKARSGEGLIPVIAMAEWGLQTEPWVFLIDHEGMVAAKFEGVANFDELETILNPLLGSTTGRFNP
jgi:hypothetical protein